jgi:hypothetical protein
MLNLDTYVYRDSRQVGGSMTGLTATTFSGNVSLMPLHLKLAQL